MADNKPRQKRTSKVTAIGITESKKRKSKLKKKKKLGPLAQLLRATNSKLRRSVKPTKGTHTIGVRG